jgi:5-methylcytosine-specific restriction endonuclease McrA
MRMLNDKRWMETKRIVWQRAEGLCEWCKRDGQEYGRKIGDEELARIGWIRAGVDCHHIIPFESAKTQAEMERLCYDPNNCVLLCIPCHVKAHKELGSKKKEAVKARRNEAFERWKDKLKNNGRDQQGQKGKDMGSHTD